MSSHHFVTDNQEPALIIANGASCSDELMGQLLEWNPLILVLDGAIDRLIQRRINFDVVLGDFDSMTFVEKDLEQFQPLEFVHRPDQEKGDLEKGIEYLIETGVPAANIIWASGNRLDHTFSNVSILGRYSDRINLVMLDDFSRVFSLPDNFRKWYKAETNISLFPLGTVEGISSVNLKYKLENEPLDINNRLGTSNEVLEDGFVEISHESGTLLLMECFDQPFL